MASRSVSRSPSLDPAVRLVGVYGRFGPDAQLDRSGLLPPVVEPADIGEFRGDVVAVAHEGAEHAACVDRGELVGVADQQDLRSGLAGGGDEFVEGEGSGQGGFVDDDQLAGPELPPVDAVAQPARLLRQPIRNRPVVAGSRRSWPR